MPIERNNNITLTLPDDAVRVIVKNTMGIGEETCEITIEHGRGNSVVDGASGASGLSGASGDGGRCIDVMRCHGKDWVTKKEYDWLMDRFLSKRDAAENHEKAFLAESQRLKRIERRLDRAEGLLAYAKAIISDGASHLTESFLSHLVDFNKEKS